MKYAIYLRLRRIWEKHGKPAKAAPDPLDLPGSSSASTDIVSPMASCKKEQSPSLLSPKGELKELLSDELPLTTGLASEDALEQLLEVSFMPEPLSDSGELNELPAAEDKRVTSEEAIFLDPDLKPLPVPQDEDKTLVVDDASRKPEEAKRKESEQKVLVESRPSSEQPSVAKPTSSKSKNSKKAKRSSSIRTSPHTSDFSRTPSLSSGSSWESRKSREEEKKLTLQTTRRSTRLQAKADSKPISKPPNSAKHQMSTRSRKGPASKAASSKQPGKQAKKQASKKKEKKRSGGSGRSKMNLRDRNKNCQLEESQGKKDGQQKNQQPPVGLSDELASGGPRAELKVISAADGMTGVDPSAVHAGDISESSKAQQEKAQDVPGAIGDLRSEQAPAEEDASGKKGSEDAIMSEPESPSDTASPPDSPEPPGPLEVPEFIDGAGVPDLAISAAVAQEKGEEQMEASPGQLIDLLNLQPPMIDNFASSKPEEEAIPTDHGSSDPTPLEPISNSEWKIDQFLGDERLSFVTEKPDPVEFTQIGETLEPPSVFQAGERYLELLNQTPAHLPPPIQQQTLPVDSGDSTSIGDQLRAHTLISFHQNQGLTNGLVQAWRCPQCDYINEYSITAANCTNTIEQCSCSLNQALQDCNNQVLLEISLEALKELQQAFLAQKVAAFVCEEDNKV